MRCIKLLILTIFVLSCGGRRTVPQQRQMEYASLLKVTDNAVISICPYDGSQDTLRIDKPLGRIVCMSTSHVAALDEIGCDSVICGVSGAGYISSPALRERLERGEVSDVGYDQAPDYEALLALQPDVVLAYRVSAAASPFIDKLKSLGIQVFTLYEFLENHPLARAEYLKAFGLMTGRLSQAESRFQEIADSYNSLMEDRLNPKSSSPEGSVPRPVKVLMNIPYGDLWYVPGDDSYMSRLVKDAGGQILGALAGKTESGVMSVELAYILSSQADVWLNTGWCNTRESLLQAHPFFNKFKVPSAYNNTLRTSPKGGNDFWESGSVHPDLILKDLRTIFEAVRNGGAADSLHYYLKVY